MKNTLIFLLALVTVTRAQVADSGLVELADQRTYFSKTYYNARDNTYLTQISAGYVHYQTERGAYKEIDTRLQPEPNGSYAVEEGLYKVRFGGANRKKDDDDVSYELPKPVKPKFYDPGRKADQPARMRWKILSLGYFDQRSKRYAVIQEANAVTPIVSGSEITYPRIFTGVAAKFSVGNVRLKDQLVLSQSGRDALPDPWRFNIPPEHAYLMLQIEFKLTPNNLNVFARTASGRAEVKRGNVYDYEGEDPIGVEDEITNLLFFSPKGVAWAQNDSATGFTGQTNVTRYLYSDKGKDYQLMGVPWRWVNAAPAGDVIIDPPVTAAASEDVWLEREVNKGAEALLLVGKGRTPMTNFFKKRTILKFDLAGASIPPSATVLNAQLKMRYYAAIQPTGGTDPWKDRWVQAHQLLRNWNELQADSLKRLTGVNWLAPRGKIGPGSDSTTADANGQFESTILFKQNEYPSWKVWDLTALTQKWVKVTGLGSAPNYGIILWATNEDTNSYDLRFRSSEYTDTTAHRPKLEVIWSTTPKTVYFLKDHLGSIRATVLDSATVPVIGYDDYDPWGYALTQRTKPIPNGYLQGASKSKFTGKERDDEYGVNWDYFGARYYDAQIGRWSSVDPLANTNPSWTPYNYVLSNPINFFDPDGRREYADGSIDPDLLGQGDWFTSDRENNTERWQGANRYNLLQESGYSEYGTMSQREAFYRWLAGSLYNVGSDVKWPAAAAWVNQIVLSARNIDAGLDAVGMGFLSGETVAGFDQINAAIMAHVWTRLGEVYSGGSLVARQARKWDEQTVILEQINNPALHQVYAGLSNNSVAELQALLEMPGAVYDANGTTNTGFLGPAFSGSIKLSVHRAAQGLRMINALQTNPQLFQAVLKGR